MLMGREWHSFTFLCVSVLHSSWLSRSLDSRICFFVPAGMVSHGIQERMRVKRQGMSSNHDDDSLTSQVL